MKRCPDCGLVLQVTKLDCRPVAYTVRIKSTKQTTGKKQKQKEHPERGRERERGKRCREGREKEEGERGREKEEGKADRETERQKQGMCSCVAKAVRNHSIDSGLIHLAATISAFQQLPSRTHKHTNTQTKSCTL